MDITVHRGTRQIGGTCIEVRSGGDRVLLDLGLPLPKPDEPPVRDMAVDDLLASGVLPRITGVYQDDAPEVRAVLMTHAHSDHFGLAPYVHPSIPIYATQGTWAAQRVLRIFTRTAPAAPDQRLLDTTAPLILGGLSVQAVTVDHSGCDAVALVVEGDGRRVLYTGDLRAHGRKGRLFQALIDGFSGTVDLLLVEGTMLGRPSENVLTESELEMRFVGAFRGEHHLCVIFCSSLNLDRLVTIYRACKRTAKTMVIDPYTALVLREHLCVSQHFPQWHWEEVRVVPWGYQQECLKEGGEGAFLDEMRPAFIGWREIRRRQRDLVLLMRTNSLVSRLEEQFGDEVKDMSFIWSMWKGYWEQDMHVRPLCERHGIEPQFLHTSGHATWDDLKRLVDGNRPRAIVPVHTEHAHVYASAFPNVRLLEDGEPMSV